MISRDAFMETIQAEHMTFCNMYCDTEAEIENLYYQADRFTDTYYEMFCFESNPVSWLDVEGSLMHVIENPRDYRHECEGEFVQDCESLLDRLREFNYIDRTDPFNLFRQRRNRRNRWESPIVSKESNSFSQNPYSQIVGLEIEVVDNTVDNHVEEYEMHDEDGDAKWDCVHDGSISAGSEFRLRTITNGDKLLNDVTSFCKTMKSKGYTVDDSCGVHMHIDFKSGNLNKLKNIINFYSRYEQFIYDIVGEERKALRFSQALRKTHRDGELYNSAEDLRFAPLADAMNTGNLKEFKKSFYQTDFYHDAQNYKYYDGRYSGLNVHSIFSNGTLELRYLRGTLNENYINNWIMFNLHIVDSFLRQNYGQPLRLLHSTFKPTVNEFYSWLDKETLGIYKKLKRSFKYEVSK